MTPDPTELVFPLRVNHYWTDMQRKKEKKKERIPRNAVSQLHGAFTQ